MTQDDFFVIAILEMCTDPELSKRFREVKTDELTWEKLREVAETYESYSKILLLALAKMAQNTVSLLTLFHYPMSLARQKLDSD